MIIVSCIVNMEIRSEVRRAHESRWSSFQRGFFEHGIPQNSLINPHFLMNSAIFWVSQIIRVPFLYPVKRCWLQVPSFSASTLFSPYGTLKYIEIPSCSLNPVLQGSVRIKQRPQIGETGRHNWWIPVSSFEAQQKSRQIQVPSGKQPHKTRKSPCY